MCFYCLIPPKWVIEWPLNEAFNHMIFVASEKIRRGRFPPHLQVGPLQRKLLWRQWALTSFLSRKKPASHKLDILEAFKHIREIGIRTTRTPYIHQTVIPTPITFSWMVLFFSPAPRQLRSSPWWTQIRNISFCVILGPRRACNKKTRG